MDYKYIEQLLERYFACETSLQEEQILRSFFSQDEQELPESLRQYVPLFRAMQQEDVLGEDFDERILAMIEEQPRVVKAREIPFKKRLMPLFKAAAIVAIILTIGGALQRPWDASWNDPHVEYANSYSLSVDSADVTPIQAENVTDMPADSAKTISVEAAKD